MMHIDHRTIKSFAAVADCLSFTKAAVALGVSQPYLSMCIKNLEARLGFALFSRTSRRVEITADGMVFLEASRAYMREAENLERTCLELSRSKANTLTIGTGNCHADVRWSLLGRFAELCPQIAVNVRIYNSSTEIWAAIRSREVDVAIVVPPIPDDLEHQSISDAQGGLILRADAPIALDRTVKPGALTGQQIAIFPRSIFPGLYDQVTSDLAAYGPSFKELPEPSRECAASFVRATGLAAIGVRWWRHERERPGDIVHRNIEGHRILLDCVLVRSPSHKVPAANRLWEIGARLPA